MEACFVTSLVKLLPWLHRSHCFLEDDIIICIELEVLKLPQSNGEIKFEVKGTIV